MTIIPFFSLRFVFTHQSYLQEHKKIAEEHISDVKQQYHDQKKQIDSEVRKVSEMAITIKNDYFWFIISVEEKCTVAWGTEKIHQYFKSKPDSTEKPSHSTLCC